MVQKSIGCFDFTSGKEAEERIKKLLWRTKRRDVMRGDDLALVSALLAQHPRLSSKFPEGFTGIYADSDGRGARCFHALTADGTAVPWSYKEALSPSSYSDRVLKAARIAIHDEIDELRLALVDVQMDCHLCGKPIDGEYHLDHVPPLVQIVDAYLDGWQQRSGIDNTPDWPELTTLPYGGLVFADEDAATFRAVHDEVAELRPAHPFCNMSKGARDMSPDDLAIAALIGPPPAQDLAYNPERHRRPSRAG